MRGNFLDNDGYLKMDGQQAVVLREERIETGRENPRYNRFFVTEFWEAVPDDMIEYLDRQSALILKAWQSEGVEQ
jgi:hypothetical protein